MATPTFIDAASLEAVLAGLMKRHARYLNIWERRAVLDLTTVLLLCDQVQLPVGPGPASTLNSYPIDIESVKIILRDVIKEQAPPRRVRNAARAEVTKTLMLYRQSLTAHFESLWDSEPVTDLLDFQWDLTLPFDARRLGGLIDPVTLKNVAEIFDWERSDYRRVSSYVSDSLLLDEWQAHYANTKRLDEVPIVLRRACIQACMVRGLYYKELARQMRGQTCWHPTRDAIERPRSPFLEAPRGIKYLVGLIVVASMLEDNSRAACDLWANNIKKARAISFRPLEEEDDSAAERAAIKFAVSARLVCRSKRMERLFCMIHDYIIGPGLLLARVITHPPLPEESPSVFYDALQGPIKARLVRFAHYRARHVYGQADEYKHLIEREVKAKGTNGFVPTESKPRRRWPRIGTSDRSRN
jgi:hypothetical protein